MKTTSLLDAFDWTELERVVILSPHLDDAALSCGGLLTALAGRASTLVVSIHCGNPPITATNPGRHRKGFIHPKIRRREDRIAMHAIEVDFVHLGFPDGVYRRSPTSGELLYRTPRERWVLPRVEDALHVEELYLVLKRLTDDMGRFLLVSPMGIGHHVDHMLTAQVALRLASRKRSILFYEDFPYVVDPRVGSGAEDGPELALARLQLRATERHALPVEVSQKVALLRHYETQIPLLFGNDAAMQDALGGRQHDGRPSEFYWRARPLFERGEEGPDE